MRKEEIKEFLVRVEELEEKLEGEDKETLQWLIFGYNQCAKLLEENEQQCKKQKEVIDRIDKYIKPLITNRVDEQYYDINWYNKDVLLSMLKEVSE